MKPHMMLLVWVSLFFSASAIAAESRLISANCETTYSGTELLKLDAKTLSITCKSPIEVQDDTAPAVMEEENHFEVSHLSFEDALRASERFSKHPGKGLKYEVFLESEDPQITIKPVGPTRAWTTKIQGHRIAFGYVSLRVQASPFLLWSAEKRSEAQKKYGMQQQGLIIDCTYGLREVAGGTVIASACIPRKAQSRDRSDIAIKQLLTQFHR